MSGLAGLVCPECGTGFEADQLQTVCQACDSPLLAQYDLPRLRRTLDREEVSRRRSGLWRWAELLPVRDPGRRLTLGEGDTPLLHLDRIGGSLGLTRLFLKDEGVNPTGTFKARGLAVAVSRAAELGAGELVLGSAGNAGGALAAYAARAGLKAHVFLPEDAPSVYAREAAAAGGEIRLVSGLIDAAGRAALQAAQDHGWFNLSTFREPYRVEGKKTMGLELAEAFGWELPEVIVYPAGGGTGLVGIWKAFEELEALGWITGARPRLVCVQPRGCAPLVRALEANAPRARRWSRARTEAHGLRVPLPYADRLILRAVRATRGAGLVVSEAEMRAAQAALARQEGVWACLEGAAAVAGLRKLCEAGQVRSEDRVVVFNTGTGLKAAA